MPSSGHPIAPVSHSRLPAGRVSRRTRGVQAPRLRGWARSDTSRLSFRLPSATRSCRSAQRLCPNHSNFSAGRLNPGPRLVTGRAVTESQYGHRRRRAVPGVTGGSPRLTEGRVTGESSLNIRDSRGDPRARRDRTVHELPAPDLLIKAFLKCFIIKSGAQ
eukprot:49682-Hanusia_phi.AAC.1